jgi:hypothetical protein
MDIWKEEKEEKQIQVSSVELDHTFFLFQFTRMSHVFCRNKKAPFQQPDPPSIPVDELFPSGEFPEGEIQQYCFFCCSMHSLYFNMT